jgi:chemotaxis protein methyltransferase CheR
MQAVQITDFEFDHLRRFFQQASGIQLQANKKTLVCGRLGKRLRHHGLRSYADYIHLIEDPEHVDERQTAVDLLTTNETHFFREPKHFELLRSELARLRRVNPISVRVWSAACSSGEEPYSLAMTLAEVLGHRPWEVFASDLSGKVLSDAKLGIYPAARIDEIPRQIAEKYVLEGVDEYEGLYRIDGNLRRRVSFGQINLMEPLPAMESFDFVFLRNVLIYFDAAAKRRIVDAISRRIKSGGLLFIGHSETLTGLNDTLKPLVPTVYRKP